MACLARSSTMTSSVPGSTWATRGLPCVDRVDRADHRRAGLRVGGRQLGPPLPQLVDDSAGGTAFRWRSQTRSWCASLAVRSDGVPPNPARLRARPSSRTHAGPADVAGLRRLQHFRPCTAAPPPPGCQAGTGVRPSGWTPARRPSRRPSRASRPGTSCPGGRSPSPTRPRCRNRTCRTWTTATATRSASSSSGPRKAGAPRPTWKTRCTPRPSSSAPWSGCPRYTKHAGAGGRPGRAAQRGRVRL